MIVKIGNTYYNSTEQPILLILSKEEKSHIANMSKKIRNIVHSLMRVILIRLKNL